MKAVLPIILFIGFLTSCKKQELETCSCTTMNEHTCLYYEQTLGNDPWGQYYLPSDTLIKNLKDYFLLQGVTLIDPSLINEESQNCISPDNECKTGRIYCASVADSTVNIMISNGWKNQ